MSKIKIETLTCVHIGSGTTLLNNNDFVVGKYNGENVISIIDPQKMFGFIGAKNIDNWLALIKKGESADTIVKLYNSKARLSDYSKRMMLNWVNGQIQSNTTIKELIHDGNGRPYIPGSSIKGSIRSAVLATMAKDKSSLDRFIRLEYKDEKRTQPKKATSSIEDSLFGRINNDFFRFIRVGDAYFGNNYEVAIKMVNINEREKNSFWDSSKPQIIEALPPEDETTFELTIDNKHNKFASERNSDIKKLASFVSSIESLFDTINKHTKDLLESEIGYWKELTSEECVNEYIEKLETILDTVKKCNNQQCVLRLGHGSGWRFITGAWSEKLDNFYDEIVAFCRPNNKRYEKYDFPKSRRVDDQCELLGFVRLTIQ